MNLLAIDPGNRTGIAQFVENRLVWCAAVKHQDLLRYGSGTCDLVLLEMPTIYRDSKADPNDILRLAVKVGEWKNLFLGLGKRVETVEPRSWKGQVPKEVQHRRMMTVLDTVERSYLVKDHNALDAVALGLWRLGR